MYQKTILMLIDSPFQSKVWRAALTSQNISVIGGTSDARVPKILEEFKTAPIPLPDLLLIDFDIDNPYDICRWCRLYYPHLKIVLVSNNQKTISSTERSWAIHQGADDLLLGFRKQNLLSSVIGHVTRILEILDCLPLQETALIPALLDFCKEVVTKSQEAKILTQSEPEQDRLSGQIVVTKNKPSATSKEQNLQSNLAKLNFLIPSSINFLLIILLVLFLLIFGRTRFGIESESNQPIAPATESERVTKPPTTFQDVTGVPVGIFNYDGSTTWAPILKLVNPAIERVYPELLLRYSHPLGDKPGSGTGIERLLEGQIDFAISSRPLKPEEYAQAKQQGFSLSQHEVGIDGIAVVVNNSLPVDGISIESLKQIYLGKITNWSQLGGPDLEIVAFSRRSEVSGTVDFFQNTVLDQENFDSRVNYVYSTTEALRKINSIPNGIYYASASEVIPQCTVKALSIGLTEDNLVSPYKGEIVPPARCPKQRNQINQSAFVTGNYPITRNLFVIVKRNGERQEVIGDAYVKLLLSREGQELVKEAGFVPIENW